LGRSSIPRNDVYPSVLHGFPTLLADSFAHHVELLVGSIPSPVGLDDLEFRPSVQLDLTVWNRLAYLLHRTANADTRIAKYSRLDHFG